MTSSIAVKSLGIIWGPAGKLYSFQEESGDQQDGCKASRTNLGSTGRVWVQAG